MMMHYDAPAREWDGALPIGNGRLGAMIFGGTAHETVQLNEDSIWSGTYRDRNNPDALANLGPIREAINRGALAEAERIGHEAFSGMPVSQRVYQTAGELFLDFFPPVSEGSFSDWGASTDVPVADYERELDLFRGTSSVRFTAGGVGFTREYFASAPDAVLVIRLRSAVSGSVSFRAGLDRGAFADRAGNAGDDGIFLTRDSDIPFCVMVRAAATGGRVFTRGGFITVEGADEAVLYADIRTGFREADPYGACAENLERCIKKGLVPILADHVSDFRALMDRSALNLALGPDESCEPLPGEKPENTDKFLARSSLAAVPDRCLVTLYWNFSRYLLVSCSREGTLPANLQGLWNRHLDPPWGCKYTININTQMNYWPAAMCGLSELETPLFDLLERSLPHGRETARVMYGCRGFVAHHNLDIWGDTAPQDHWTPATLWTLGGAWLATHIRNHYEITGDREALLRRSAALIESCRFFTEYLVPMPGAQAKVDMPGISTLVLIPSVSPENSYIAPSGEKGSLCGGCTMDSQILRSLFAGTIRTIEELSDAGVMVPGLIDGELERFRAVYASLPKTEIHSNGTIREWHEEYEEADPGHRHLSHLWDLYPGTGIDVRRTPELADAARATLERRLANGGGHTGWSRAWIINFRASLGDGEGALADLAALFSRSTLPNLFDNHPPFQIDGNFGALAGITRMIAQGYLVWPEAAGASAAGSSADNHGESRCRPKFAEIRLLPALPADWAEGSLRGIMLPGGLSLALTWKAGRPERISIEWNGAFASPVDGTLKLKLVFTGEEHTVALEKGRQETGVAFGARFKVFAGL